MSARVFVDTNVLVYWRDASEPAKQKRAQEWLERLWESAAGRISLGQTGSQPRFMDFMDSCLAIPGDQGSTRSKPIFTTL